MALRAVFRSSSENTVASLLGLGRSVHSLALPVVGTLAVDLPLTPQPPAQQDSSFFSEDTIGFQPQFPTESGSMELMAVPKKKISKHKRGIRNGPKALKPIPVIIRCGNCGKVKLPHFYCCGGRREASREN